MQIGDKENMGAGSENGNLARQALAKQGFKGGSRGDTEWSQWVQSEKEQLSAVMERHGIEWEHKGTHEKHLSVLDYKKQEREKEVVQLEGQILEKKEEFQILYDRVENYDKGIENLKTLEQVLDTSPEYQLPEPQGVMSAKTYKNKLAEPLVCKAGRLLPSRACITFRKRKAHRNMGAKAFAVSQRV